MAEKQEKTVSVRGAFGFYHSVPESQVEQFLKEQRELEESGELTRRLNEQAERVAKLYGNRK